MPFHIRFRGAGAAIHAKRHQTCHFLQIFARRMDGCVLLAVLQHSPDRCRCTASDFFKRPFASLGFCLFRCFVFIPPNGFAAFCVRVAIIFHLRHHFSSKSNFCVRIFYVFCHPPISPTFLIRIIAARVPACTSNTLQCMQNGSK